VTAQETLDYARLYASEYRNVEYNLRSVGKNDDADNVAAAAQALEGFVVTLERRVVAQ
jgi:hypothetical protein